VAARLYRLVIATSVRQKDGIAMTWLALDVPPITLIHPDHRPLALGVMGLLRYRLPENAHARRTGSRWSDGYERLLRRVCQVGEDEPALVRPEKRDAAVAGVWALLNQVSDRRQAEMLALYYGLAVEPTRPLTLAQAGSVYDLTPARARRLIVSGEAALRSSAGLAALRRQIA
jgi:hypothetical protein